MLKIILDFARAVAALGVFAYHIKPMLDPSGFLAKLASCGNLGVPLFFVISGYCVTSAAKNSLRKCENPGRFLKRRFLRIFPPFWASIIVVLFTPYMIEAISSIKSGIYIWPTAKWQSLEGIEWLQIVTLTRVFYNENGDLQGAFNPVNSVYWTLAIEFQFYLVMYIALLTKKHFETSIVLITLLSTTTFLWPEVKHTGLFIGYWPMFALGIGLYFLLRRNITLDDIAKGYGLHISLASIISLSILFVILATTGRLVNFTFSSNDFSFTFAVFCLIFLWLSTPIETILESAKHNGHAIAKWMVKGGSFLGVISYSLYLLHGKIYLLPEMFARQMFQHGTILYPVFTILGTIFISWLFFYCFEQPFMSSRHLKINESVLK